MRKPSPYPRGAALILAMLFAALAATIAMALASDQQRWLAGVSNRHDQVEAQALALAGVQWARQILYEDGRAGPVDHLGEPWAYALPPTPIEGGTIEGRIVDAQGRINLNNIARADSAGVTERAALDDAHDPTRVLAVVARRAGRLHR